MSRHPDQNVKVVVSDLSPGKPYRFDIRPEAEDLTAIAGRLGLEGLRKLRFEGALKAEGKRDWRLEAKLGATVIQPCVVTLEPVTTRLDDTVTRRFLADWPPQQEQGDEVEMDEDDSIDALGDVIDLASVMEEALALALPLYPRKEGAEATDAQAQPEGAEPFDEAALKPFAGLADLKKKLEGNG